MRIFLITHDLEAFKQETAVHGNDYHYAEIKPGLWVVNANARYALALEHLAERGHHPLPRLDDAESAVPQKILDLLPAAVGHKPGDKALTVARKLHAHARFRGLDPSLY